MVEEVMEQLVVDSFLFVPQRLVWIQLNVLCSDVVERDE